MKLSCENLFTEIFNAHLHQYFIVCNRPTVGLEGISFSQCAIDYSFVTPLGLFPNCINLSPSNGQKIPQFLTTSLQALTMILEHCEIALREYCDINLTTGLNVSFEQVAV